MRAFEFLLEAEESQIGNLQQILSKKIVELPADETTLKALKEVEVLLNNIQAGGRLGYVNGKLEEIGDEDVTKARKLLAKYFLSLQADPDDRKDLLARWKSDQLVDIEKLTSPVAHKIPDVINGYKENPAIKEFTDDLVEVAALGQGKGEFMLSVFSKRINKKAKGDLVINGKDIELKTNDGGAGRFFDQEVRPKADWASQSENYMNTYAEEIIAALGKKTDTGIKIDNLSKIAEVMPVEKQDQHKKDLTSIIQAIFTTQDVGPVVADIIAGQDKSAKQRYARLSLDNYMAIKPDDAILMIDLRTDPYSLAYFSNAKDLYNVGLRLHAGTIYPVATDPRYAYPQVKISATTQAQPE
jgi:hypothetical protein